MKIVLTVVLAAIFLAAVWSGYRRGLILSAAQLAAIVVALYGAALLAGLFSDRLLPVAEPFAGGYFEGQLDMVATELPDNDAGLSGEDWVAAHPDTAQEYAEQCFAAAGVTGRPAQRMAAFGAVNGVCFGILLCWALQFAGPVIGRDTLAHTALAKALQAIDVLTLGVGV